MLRWSHLYIAIVAAFAVVCAPAKEPRTPVSAVTPEVKNPERHQAFLKRIQEGPVGLLFLGDSITDFWPSRSPETWAKFAPYQPANFGISGDRTEHLLWRLQNGELEGIAPKAVVILIGTNNIGHFDDEKPAWAVEGVREVVRTVRSRLPDARVLLLAVFPRGATRDVPKRRMVEEINAGLKGLADGERVVFLDLSDRFVDAEGKLRKELMPDALHPSAEGYRVWFEGMWPVLEPMLR